MEISKDLLEKLYYQEKLPIKEIAKRLSVPQGSIGFYINRHGISKRRFRITKFVSITSDVLRDLYVVQGKTALEIAKEFGCTEALVRYRLDKFGIPIRRTGPTHFWKKTEQSKVTSGRATNFEIGFVVGMLLGEGSIGISINEKVARNGLHLVFHPFISIANTDTVLLREVYNLIGGKLKKMSVLLDSHLAVYDTLKKLESFLLSTKKEVANLVLRFCESRMKHPYDDYTLEELEIVKKVRLLGRKCKRNDIALNKLEDYINGIIDIMRKQK